MTTQDKEDPAAAFRRVKATVAAAEEKIRALLKAHGYVVGAEVRRDGWEKEYKLTCVRVSSIIFIHAEGHFRLKSGGWSRRTVRPPGNLTDYEVLNRLDPTPTPLERAIARAEKGEAS